MASGDIDDILKADKDKKDTAGGPLPAGIGVVSGSDIKVLMEKILGDKPKRDPAHQKFVDDLDKFRKQLQEFVEKTRGDGLGLSIKSAYGCVASEATNFTDQNSKKHLGEVFVITLGMVPKDDDTAGIVTATKAEVTSEHCVHMLRVGLK